MENRFSKVIAFSLHPYLYERLNEFVRKRDVTRSQVIRQAVTEYMDKHESR